MQKAVILASGILSFFLVFYELFEQSHYHLPSPKDNIVEAFDASRILEVLQDFNYIGMMKERWEEIKRSQPANATTP